MSPAASLLVAADGLPDLPLCRWILADLERLADDDGVVTAELRALGRVLGVDVDVLGACLDALEGARLVRRMGLHIHLVPLDDVEASTPSRDPQRDSVRDGQRDPSRDDERAAQRVATTPQPQGFERRAAWEERARDGQRDPQRDEDADAPLLAASELEKPPEPAASSALRAFFREVWRDFAQATGKRRGLTRREKTALSNAFEMGARAEDFRWAMRIDAARGGQARSVLYFFPLAREIVDFQRQGKGGFEAFCRAHESPEVCERLGFLDPCLNQWMLDPSAYEAWEAPSAEGVPARLPDPDSELWQRFREALAEDLDAGDVERALAQVVLVDDSKGDLELAAAPGGNPERWEVWYTRALHRLDFGVRIDREVAA